jgi:hypothetical protein
MPLNGLGRLRISCTAWLNRPVWRARASPAEAGDAQDQRAIRVPFLLVTFLWARKEK